MSKIIASLVLVLCSAVSIAQQSGSIRHFQRSWSTDSIHLPCEKWELKGLNINVPDSLYDSGTIAVKKMKYQGIRGFRYSVEIKDGRANKVVVTCKGKQQLDMLLTLDAYLYQVYGNDKECALISFMNASKRKGRLIITLK